MIRSSTTGGGSTGRRSLLAFMPEPHARARSGCCRTVNWYHRCRFSLVTRWMRWTMSREAEEATEVGVAMMPRGIAVVEYDCK